MDTEACSSPVSDKHADDADVCLMSPVLKNNVVPRLDLKISSEIP